MVIESTFLIPLLSREPVALQREASKARLAVRRELLAIDQRTTCINHHVATANVIAQVELDRRAPIIRVCGTQPDEGDALLVIHHVYMVVLSGLGLPAPAVMLKEAIDVMCHFDLPALPAHQLLHPLPGRVVEIMCVDRGLRA